MHMQEKNRNIGENYIFFVRFVTSQCRKLK